MSKLTLLSGQIKDLKVRRMTKSVFASNSPQKLAEAGALTAAALGSVYASTVMASSRLKMTHEVEVFSCEINGIKLVGCFGEVTFMNHNTIEFVVEYVDDEKTEAIAHAARNKQKNVIWVAPYQDKGESCHRGGINKASIIFPAVTVIGGVMIMLIIGLLEGDLNLFFLIQLSGVGLVVGAVMSFFLRLLGRLDLKDTKQATKIFEAFGYQKPSEVNLFENNLDIQLEIEDKLDKSLPDMPRWVYRYRDSDLVGGSE